MTLHGVYARHIAGIPGWEVPDAIGVIFDKNVNNQVWRVVSIGKSPPDIRLSIVLTVLNDSQVDSREQEKSFADFHV